MIIALKIQDKYEQFVINELSHIVSNGVHERDENEPFRWHIDLTKNNWWARVKDGVLTVSGRYADEQTMEAVKRMLFWRCDGAVKDIA